MKFITLTSADTGMPYLVNLAHVRVVMPPPQGDGATLVSLTPNSGHMMGNYLYVSESFDAVVDLIIKILNS